MPKFDVLLINFQLKVRYTRTMQDLMSDKTKDTLNRWGERCARQQGYVIGDVMDFGVSNTGDLWKIANGKHLRLVRFFMAQVKAIKNVPEPYIEIAKRILAEVPPGLTATVPELDDLIKAQEGH